MTDWFGVNWIDWFEESTSNRDGGGRSVEASAGETWQENRSDGMERERERERTRRREAIERGGRSVFVSVV